MKLERHYFISDDLDDLERVEEELEAAGVTAPQIHVLSRDNANVQRHENLSGVTSFMKRDLLFTALVGLVIGSALAVITLWVSYFVGWQDSAAGAIPFVLLGIALIGACTWVGGLWGIQRPNHHFQRFQSVLDEGKHVLLVDLEADESQLLKEVCARHGKLKFAGTGESTPGWIIAFSNYTKSWWYWNMWKNV